MGDRIQAILLLDGGRSLKEVAQILRVSPKTIKRWVKIFVGQGFEALCTLAYEGTEPDVTPAQMTRLRAWLDEQIRSTKEARDWVEREFGLSYSESGIVKLLKRIGYSYKKPAQVPSKADPKAQAEWVAEYGEKRGPRVGL